MYQISSLLSENSLYSEDLNNKLNKNLNIWIAKFYFSSIQMSTVFKCWYGIRVLYSKGGLNTDQTLSSIQMAFEYSSLHKIIPDSFRLLFVLWSLLPTEEAFYLWRHSCSKISNGEGKFTFYGLGYYFHHTLSPNLSHKRFKKETFFFSKTMT